MPTTKKTTARKPCPARTQPCEPHASTSSSIAAAITTTPKRIEIALTLRQSNRNTMTANSSQPVPITRKSHQNLAAASKACSVSGVDSSWLTQRLLRWPRVRRAYCMPRTRRCSGRGRDRPDHEVENSHLGEPVFAACELALDLLQGSAVAIEVSFVAPDE